MALTPVKVLLFLAGGTTAVGGTAYVAGVFDPFLNPQIPQAATAASDTQKLAALPDAQAPAAQSDTPKPADGTPTAEASKPPAGAEKPQQQAALSPAADQPKIGAAEPRAAAETLPQPAVEAPAFDLVRVEADGSIVIAGHAAPNAKVDAIIGSRVIGSAVAGPGGDFAIVLDEPLAPGDYQIVLRSTAPGNVVAMSTETATVAVPETPEGQVLALVEEPGKPSELITVPEPKQPGAETQAAAKPPGTDTGGGKSEPAQEPAAGTASPQPAAGATGELAAGGAKDAPGATAENQGGTPDGKAAGGEQAVAAATPNESLAKSAQEQAADGPKIAVEAVEIEGRRIFVAGSADPGRVVRAYANEILLGDATTSQAGRFLVEAERDLPVGDYIIRVDALGQDGAKVIARAAVPFEREAGENVAAVAALGEPQPAESEPAAPAGEGGAAGTQPRLGNADTAQAPAAEAQAGQGVSQTASAAAPAQPAAPAADKPAEIAAAQPSTDAPATPGIAPKPADAAAIAPKPADPAPATTETPAAAAPGPATAQPAPAGGAETAAAPADALSPKLQNVGGSVIIRRGDSLWRISRRVYGHGLRYSTIYLANQHQIDDPDRIYPGQVFAVPTKTERGEEADMTRLGEQAVSPVVRQ
ncbi:LysM peptidoglycan-binding domain-containing protein [Mesorhizobium sp. LHD-90]|uniref:LysM peptidoglycan-binding domain-containing protein n=1 Tax=Mesorhizobium sp. LHD-90 TaxID=3071414 RepID=UPI0027E04E9F|nr:LysM peptidoglycan-binding domain-containing protein [Mesorhizobium sp. LHD-90]MDQ6435137.1 LysM peptidoglycan-binding domain-containing protein [Mesorhizobium sp. LHD-90]